MDSKDSLASHFSKSQSLCCPKNALTINEQCLCSLLFPFLERQFFLDLFLSVLRTDFSNLVKQMSNRFFGYWFWQHHRIIAEKHKILKF